MDVMLNEGRRIARKVNGVPSLASLKRMALNIIRADVNYGKRQNQENGSVQVGTRPILSRHFKMRDPNKIKRRMA